MADFEFTVADNYLASLANAHGGPAGQGLIRQQLADFFVEEQLSVERRAPHLF